MKKYLLLSLFALATLSACNSTANKSDDKKCAKTECCSSNAGEKCAEGEKKCYKEKENCCKKENKSNNKTCE